MKFSKVKLKNINTKLIASVLGLSLLTTPLLGCSSKDESMFEYTISEQGEYQTDGTIGYQILKRCNFCVIENSYGNTEYYIANVIECKKTNYYYNILDGQLIFDDSIESQRNIVCCEEMEEHLLALSKVKAFYTGEEIKQIK